MSSAKAKNLDDLKSLHDPDTVIRKKITTQLAAMLKRGPEEWDYEGDFLKQARIGTAAISPFREAFKAHLAVTKPIDGMRPRTIWFADPKVAKRFRGE